MPSNFQGIEEARSLINAAGKIVVLTGAGISKESGVPTFRDADGLWEGYDPMQLATPEAFHRHPELVWRFYNHRRNALSTVKPNPGHDALVRLEKLKPNFTLVTQNVDRLHQGAGSQNVIELHGNIWDMRCTQCEKTFEKFGQLYDTIPQCEDEGAMLRPSVVWFGEMLPPGAMEKAQEDTIQSDLLIIVGTSGVVYPAAGLGQIAHQSGSKIIEINPDDTPLSDLADIELRGPSGEILPLLIP